MKKAYDILTAVIGNTPLVKVPFPIDCAVYAKLEYLNPGYSIKDRTALFMIESAEKAGVLKPGGTIIEASSGNQGIAAAMIGNIKGYRVVITVTDKISKEKLMTLRAYGAEVVVCPSGKLFSDPEHYHAVATRLAKEEPGSFMLNQYFNENNRKTHEQTTGREIWEQSEGKITHFIGALGSGGTVAGIGKFLKEKNKNIVVLGVDSPCSYAATKGNPKPYHIEGMGIDYDTPFFDTSCIDGVLYVTDEETERMVKLLPYQYGFLVGPASAAVAHAVLTYAEGLSRESVVGTIFTDSGRAYLARYFS